jgi:hypothetical protein
VSRLLRLPLLLGLLTIFLSTFAMALEEPKYSSITSLGDVEFRLYAPYLVAETFVAGEPGQSQAANTGFRRLFSYISGNNKAQESIAMTAPVQQQAVSRKMSMTLPVQQMPKDEGWLISFVVPTEFDINSVPTPGNPEVRIQAIPEQLMAVLTYSGRWTEQNRHRHTQELLDALEGAGIKLLGIPVYASYNSPFSLPFTRRNEIMVAVASAP